MNEKNYRTDIEVLKTKMDMLCTKFDKLLDNLEDCPVYKDRTDNNTDRINMLTREVKLLSDILNTIKGKFYAVSVLIGLGSSIISGSIVFFITRAIVGG